MEPKRYEYNLTTPNGSEIRAVLFDRPYYIDSIENLRSRIKEFGFEIISGGGNDKDIQHTLTLFLNAEIDWRFEVLLVFYDNQDGKPIARRRLFDRWFRQMEGVGVEKLDFNVTLEDGLGVYFSVFVGRENDERDILIPLLQEIAAAYDKA